MMTGTQFDVEMTRWGFSRPDAAKFFGTHEATVRRWAQKGPPYDVGLLVCAMRAKGWTAEQVKALAQAGLRQIGGAAQ